MNFNPDSPLLSVVMITYNHDKFISEAINGVLMQQCNFSIELIIADDCSTDKTKDVVQDYLVNNANSAWIKYFRQADNVGMMNNFIFALNQCKGKYIAFCEGDDYWTNPYKLQKQVDFLENNLAYSVCWTKYQVLDQNVLKQEEVFKRVEFNKDTYNVTLDSLFDPYAVHTSTCLFKNDTDFSMLPDLIHAKDNTIYALLLLQGEGVILNIESAVYRLHAGGIFSSRTELSQIADNYYNLKEINNALLKNRVLRLKQIESSFLYLMFCLTCNSPSKNLKVVRMMAKIYFSIILSSPWKTKYLASKEILKQVYLRFKVKYNPKVT